MKPRQPESNGDIVGHSIRLSLNKKPRKIRNKEVGEWRYTLQNIISIYWRVDNENEACRFNNLTFREQFVSKN